MYDKFKVYAVSVTGGTQKTVMEGYEVKFVSDSWTYVTDTQELMFWDSKADSYLFTAGAPINAVTDISATAMQLHLKNNTSGSAMAAEPLKIERGSQDFGKIVNLRFGYAHCRVCVAFVKNTESDITDITLKPTAAITSEADLTYTYDWSTSTASTQLTSTATSSDSFYFNSVNIPAGTADAVLSSTRYYCVPDASNPTGWTVSLKCGEEQKSGTFVNEQAWESGKNYIYIFSLDGKTPKLIYVLAGDMDDYFDCNDIVPGGDFSDSDMTE